MRNALNRKLDFHFIQVQTHFAWCWIYTALYRNHESYVESFTRHSWPKLTFLMSTSASSPQPRSAVLNGASAGYCRFWKRWFWHFSPAGHTCGWHSIIRIRLRQSLSGPHGFSMVGLQSQGWHCEMSNTGIWTLPTGLLTWSGGKMHKADILLKIPFQNRLRAARSFRDHIIMCNVIQFMHIFRSFNWLVCTTWPKIDLPFHSFAKKVPFIRKKSTIHRCIFLLSVASLLYC